MNLQQTNARAAQCPVQGIVFEVCNDVIVRHDVCRAMHTSCFHNYTLEWGADSLMF
jgi:hypothetical protein